MLEKIKKKYAEAQIDRANIQTKYNEIADFTLPYYTKFKAEGTTIKKNTAEIIPVILESSDSFCNFIASSLFGNISIESELDKETFEDIQTAANVISLSMFDEVSEKLQKDTKRAHKFLESSNMTQSVLKSLPEAVNLGTGCIKMIENKGISNPFTFKHISNSSFTFTTDTFGRPNYVFVSLGSYDRDQLINQFPTITLSNLPKEKERIDVIETIAITDKGFQQIISDRDFQHILYKGEITFNPYIVYRLKHFSNNVMGKGLGFSLIDNFRKLSRYRDLEDLSAEQAINPSTTYFGDPNSYNNLNTTPGTISYGGNAPNYELRQNNLVGNLVPIDGKIQRLEKEIQDMYLAQPLGGYNDRAQTTATEVEQRIELFRQRFSSTYTNLSEELLKPIFFNALSIMNNKKMLKFDTDYFDLVSVIYTNEITKAQKRDEAQRLIEYKTTMLQTNERYEQILIDPIEYGSKVGELLGIDKEIFSTKDEVKQQEQVEQLRQQETMPEGFGSNYEMEGSEGM